jgi:hypothetical protein
MQWKGEGKTLRSNPIESARRPLPEAAAAPLPNETVPVGADLEAELAKLERLSLDDLRLRWRNHWGRLAPAHLSRGLLLRVMAYRLQADAFGDLDRKTIRMLDRLADDAADRSASNGLSAPDSNDCSSAATLAGRQTSDPLILKRGTLLTREWQGRIERVTVVSNGFAWNGATYASLSAVAFAITGTKWNGHRFFGVRRRDRVQAGERDGDPIEVVEAKGQALWRAARRTIGLSRRGARLRHRRARQRMLARGPDEGGCRQASALRDLHPRLD